MIFLRHLRKGQAFPLAAHSNRARLGIGGGLIAVLGCKRGRANRAWAAIFRGAAIFGGMSRGSPENLFDHCV